MIIGAIIVGLIIIGLIILINHISSNGRGDMDTGVILGMMVTIFCVIEIGILSKIIEVPKPTPMDVYQGKTTLEITYRDSVPVDSIVVYKEEFKTRFYIIL